MTFDEIKQLIDEHNVQYADLRFTNTKGKEQHITLPIHLITESFFSDGKLFDGSSMPGWCTINKSDMLLMPVDDSCTLILLQGSNHHHPLRHSWY